MLEYGGPYINMYLCLWEKYHSKLDVIMYKNGQIILAIIYHFHNGLTMLYYRHEEGLL